MLQYSERGMGSKNDTIMFTELSAMIQQRILEAFNLQSPSERFWDVVPVAYLYNDKMELNQNELDEEALLQLGVM